jgi:hypothetical protein
MKRKRGRPRGKTYPEPDPISKALDTAMYGKIGASEAMALLRDSPFPTLDYIKEKPPKKRNAVDKEYLRRAPEFIERWSRRAGQILCDKVALRDVKFFRDLADALEELSKETQPIESFRRYAAIEYKLLCEANNVPFTSKGFSDYYKRRNPGDTIDSSTFSKIMRWARTAKPSYEDVARELGPPQERPENPILKP